MGLGLATWGCSEQEGNGAGRFQGKGYCSEITFSIPEKVAMLLSMFSPVHPLSTIMVYSHDVLPQSVLVPHSLFEEFN